MTDQTHTGGPGRYRDHRRTTGQDMPARPRGERVPTEPRAPVWSPEEISLIRHIAEEVHNVDRERSSAALWSDFEAAVRTKVRELNRPQRRREVGAWSAAIASVVALVIQLLRSWAIEAEREPTPPIAIPIVEPSPNAEQVQSQGATLEQLQLDLEALRAELAAERAERESKAKGKRPK